MDGIKENHIKYVIVLMLLVITTILIITSQEGYDDKRSNNSEESSALGISAETSGSSPESGATSRLKQAYDHLVSLGTNYGDSQPSDYPYGNKDHGTYWNRILYSAFYSPPGDATSSDVRSGKTFYSQYSRTLKTGTAQTGTNPGAYNQQYVQYDHNSISSYTGADSQWIQTSSASGSHVWYDTRTGLYWARSQPTTLTNSFSSPSTGHCTFFSSTPRSSYTSSNTVPSCGNAINACATLSLASTEGQSAKTDWYLPSQTELIRAYRNGIYNQAGSTFTTISLFWSSTEYSSNSAYAWRVYLHSGSTGYSVKTFSTAVRCVRRD